MEILDGLLNVLRKILVNGVAVRPDGITAVGRQIDGAQDRAPCGPDQPTGIAVPNSAGDLVFLFCDARRDAMSLGLCDLGAMLDPAGRRMLIDLPELTGQGNLLFPRNGLVAKE